MAESSEQPATPTSSDEKRIPCSWQYLSVCILVPLSCGGINGAPWAGITLHFNAMGWDLWKIGLVSLLGFGSRAFIAVLLGKVGHLVTLLLAVMHLACALAGLIFPENEAAVLIQLLGIVAFDVFVAVERLAFATYKHSRVQATQATGSVLQGVVVSYALSSSIGGGLYDLGGWRGFSVYHVVVQSAQVLMFLTDPIILASVKEARLLCQKQAAQESEDTGKATPESKKLPKDLYLPAVFISAFAGLSMLSYQAEWSTYALFFKEQHGWNQATWSGLAQTSGDVLAAVLMKIVPYMRFGNLEDGFQKGGWRRFVATICLPPYSAAAMCFYWMACNVGMIVPSLVVAVTAQVLMGTVFVVSIQQTQDMLVTYSLGDENVFARMSVLSKNFEAIGSAFGGCFGLLLYQEVGPASPFVLCATISALVGIMILLGFGARRAKSGGRGGRARRLPRRTPPWRWRT
ncbi:unnamed protein product [Effrenium voratum]|nr:unnamed protein product [Effrenium voratum]